MKSKLLLLGVGLSAGIALTVLAKGGSGGSGGSSSVSAVGGHASGFSQPPVTVSSGETSANATTSDSTAGGGSSGGASTSMGGEGTGERPPPNPDDASFPGYPTEDTNNAPTNAESGSDIMIRSNSVANINPHMNVDGDITNANGTMTYDTSKPNWWVKKN
jgi:hypothetical protein